MAEYTQDDKALVAHVIGVLSRNYEFWNKQLTLKTPNKNLIAGIENLVQGLLNNSFPDFKLESVTRGSDRHQIPVGKDGIGMAVSVNIDPSTEVGVTISYRNVQYTYILNTPNEPESIRPSPTK